MNHPSGTPLISVALGLAACIQCLRPANIITPSGPMCAMCFRALVVNIKKEAKP